MRKQAIIKNETTFGLMKVLKEVKPRIRNNGDVYRYFLMKCQCGNEHICPLQSLRNGHSISCGCVKRNFLINFNTGKNQSKENSPRWIEDRTKLSKYIHGKERRSPAYKYWKNEVKKRDNWQCKINNSDCEGQLNSHHILNWKEYPELRYDINNGITLCQFHHPHGKIQEAKLSPYLKELINIK